MCFKRLTTKYVVGGADSAPPPGWNRVKESLAIQSISYFTKGFCFHNFLSVQEDLYLNNVYNICATQVKAFKCKFPKIYLIYRRFCQITQNSNSHGLCLVPC